MCRRLMCVVFAAVVVCAPVASAQNFLPNVWGTIGATGIVDEADQSLHVFNNTGSVAIAASAASATVDLRYPIGTMPANNLVPGECVQLRAMIRDTGADARVILRVMRVNVSSGTQRSLGEIDSNDTPIFSGTDYHLHQTCLNVSSMPDFPIDSALFAYYVHAQLIKTTRAGNPGLLVLQICNPDEACQP